MKDDYSHISEIDCLVDLKELIKKSQKLKLNELINYAMDFEHIFQYGKDIDEILCMHLGGEELALSDIDKLRNLYVLIQAPSLDEDGNVYITGLIKP